MKVTFIAVALFVILLVTFAPYSSAVSQEDVTSNVIVNDNGNLIAKNDVRSFVKTFDTVGKTDDDENVVQRRVSSSAEESTATLNVASPLQAHLFGRSERKARAIKKILKAHTSVGQGALFAVLDLEDVRYGRHIRDSDIDVWTYGAIKSKNSIRLASTSKITGAYMALKYANLKNNLERTMESYGYNPVDYNSSDIMKVKHLLSMRSGLLEYAQEQFLVNFSANPINWNYDGAFTNQRDVDLAWYQQPVNFIPNTLYCYTNTAFALVGELLRKITGLIPEAHIKIHFRDIAPSLHYDDGSIPAGGWPAALSYQNWELPPTMPGYAGSLVARTRDAVRVFARIVSDRDIFRLMQTWHPMTPKCTGIGSDTAAGNLYGYGLQKYIPMYKGPVVGHDGRLNTRTFLGFSCSLGKIYLVHLTDDVSNADLLQATNELMYADDHYSNCGSC